MPARAAALELLATGCLRRRSEQADVIAHLVTLGWVGQSTRAREVVLHEHHRTDVEALLDHQWPEWREIRQRLDVLGLSPNPHGLRALAQGERRSDLTHLTMPTRVNRRTLASLVAPHSKVAVSAEQATTVGVKTLTHDGVLRIRPNQGLRVRLGAQDRLAEELAALAGELLLTERALLDGTTLCGQLPEVVLTVENRGAYVDLPLPPWMAAVHVPGWDTPMVSILRDQVPDARIVHFGDLDRNGLEILRHLRAEFPRTTLFVPEFWSEQLETTRLQSCTWYTRPPEADEYALISELVERGAWLEQEVIVLDPRMEHALEDLRERTARATP